MDCTDPIGSRNSAPRPDPTSQGFYCAKDTRTTGGVWECTKRKCLSKSKGRPKPPVMPETTERLTEYLKGHNKIFYQLVGRDFGWPAD